METTARKTNKRKSSKNRRENALIVIVFLVISMIVTLFSFNVFCTALELWCISAEIHDLNEYSSWDAEDTARYEELNANRQTIKDGSLIGNIMVSAGANPFTKLIRELSIIALFIFMMCFMYLWLILIADLLKNIIQKILFKIHRLCSHKA